MFEFNSQKYLVRDEAFQKECEKIFFEIETALKNDSYTELFLCGESLEKLSIILSKNNNDYKKCYKENQDRFEYLKQSISWDFVEPLTSFETVIKSLFCQIEELLYVKDYNTNKQARVKLIEAENILSQFIENNSFVDRYIRNQYFNKLNEIRRNYGNNDLISILLCEKSFAEMEDIKKANNEKYIKFYLSVLKKRDMVNIVFEKYRQFLSPADLKSIEQQFIDADFIMKCQDYSRFDEAFEIYDMISFRVSENSNIRKTKIVENIKKDVDSLKTLIWLEDWEIIRNGIDSLIIQAEESGIIYNLNLDKFHVEQKKNNKKEKIREFINLVHSSKNKNDSTLIDQARNMISSEAYLKDLELLENQIGSSASQKSEKKFVQAAEKNFVIKHIKYIVLGVLLVISIIFYGINHVKNAEHYESKGMKYADIVEAVVYSLKKSNSDIDKEEVRRRIHAPRGEMEIISISDKEVVIEFKNKIYKKDVRLK